MTRPRHLITRTSFLLRMPAPRNCAKFSKWETAVIRTCESMLLDHFHAMHPKSKPYFCLARLRRPVTGFPPVEQREKTGLLCVSSFCKIGWVGAGPLGGGSRICPCSQLPVCLELEHPLSNFRLVSNSQPTMPLLLFPKKDQAVDVLLCSNL